MCQGDPPARREELPRRLCPGRAAARRGGGQGPSSPGWLLQLAGAVTLGGPGRTLGGTLCHSKRRHGGVGSGPRAPVCLGGCLDSGRWLVAPPLAAHDKCVYTHTPLQSHICTTHTTCTHVHMQSSCTLLPKCESHGRGGTVAACPSTGNPFPQSQLSPSPTSPGLPLPPG